MNRTCACDGRCSRCVMNAAIRQTDIMLSKLSESSKRFRTDFIDDHGKPDHLTHKFWDQENTYNARDTASIWDISTVPQGFSPWERQGNSIRVTHVFLRIVIQQSFSQTYGTVRAMLCRVILYIDKACHGTSGGTSTDILNNCQVTLGATSPDDLYNPHTVPTRYEIIYDDMILLGPLRGTASAGAGAGGSSYTWQNSAAPTAPEVGYDNYGPQIEALWNRALDKHVNVPIQFAGATSNPALSNQIKLLMIGEDSVTLARGWDVLWKTRITFTDGD